MEEQESHHLLIHQRANFPSELNLSRSSHSNRIEEGSRSSSSIALDQDIECFGIAGRTWPASYRLLDYLFPPTTTHPVHLHHDLPPAIARQTSSSSPTGPVQFDPPSPILSPSTRSSTASRRITLLDLGSGTGHLPIELARRLTRAIPSLHSIESIQLIATDLPAVVPLLERNLLRNSRITTELKSQEPKISLDLIVQPLSWGHTHQILHLIQSFISPTHHHHPPHFPRSSQQLIITCSDLIFFPFLFAPLIHTLLILTSSDYQHLEPIILIGYKERSATKEFPFFALIGRYFRIEPILSRSNSSDPWELPSSGRSRTDPSNDHQPDDDDRLDRIYLLRLTRLRSTLDLDLSFLSDDSAEDRQLHLHGDPTGIDQWEWILLSQLDDS